jgi:hypothetical protein
VHPVRSGGQPVPDVRWAGREDAPAHVPSRLVLSALLPGLRAGHGVGRNPRTLDRGGAPPRQTSGERPVAMG